MSGARVAAAAKRVSLATEAAMLRKQQALEQEELRLQQRKQQLALETEIVKVKSEECVRAEAEARFTPTGKNKGFRSIIPLVFITDFCEPEVSKVMLSDSQRLSTRTEQLPISDLSDGREPPAQRGGLLKLYRQRGKIPTVYGSAVPARTKS